MRCMKCHQQATFKETVFQGTAPTTVKLCNACADKVDVEHHLTKIHAAANHEDKNAAVGSFLSALEA